MFARFARIGVGHVSLMLAGQSPALVIEATEESDEGEDLGMQVYAKHQAAHNDHDENEDDVDEADDVGDDDNNNNNNNNNNDDNDNNDDDDDDDAADDG